jgi:hypothetical protein
MSLLLEGSGFLVVRMREARPVAALLLAMGFA